ncbi:MAG TPA: hypothetical protein VFO08_11805 [Methylomirabilota bacterium]|jgi:hypothetical protein|nr:hypothetical protein [Methylomirabilota bacterium]
MSDFRGGLGAVLVLALCLSGGARVLARDDGFEDLALGFDEACGNKT